MEIVMDDRKLPCIDAEKLKELLQNEFEQCIADVTQAVNDGRAGSVIDDSEEPVRQAAARFRQQVIMVLAEAWSGKMSARLSIAMRPVMYIRVAALP